MDRPKFRHIKTTESVRTIMKKDLITFTPDIKIREAVKVLIRNKISGAPVVNQDGELVGVLSEKDCLVTVLSNQYYGIPGGIGTVADFMSTVVKTIGANETIMDAAYQFEQSKFRRFPVIDQGTLVGQISRRDVLIAILKIRPHSSKTSSSLESSEHNSEK